MDSDPAIAARGEIIQKLERLVWDAIYALQKAGLDSEAARLRRGDHPARLTQQPWFKAFFRILPKDFEKDSPYNKRTMESALQPFYRFCPFVESTTYVLSAACPRPIPSLTTIPTL